jgi:hypothetical protein
MDWLRDFPFQEAPSYCMLISAPAPAFVLAKSATHRHEAKDDWCSAVASGQSRSV